LLLLRARRERPRRHAPEQRDQVAPSHDSSPEYSKDTTGVTALQGIKAQSTGWTRPLQAERVI
jgi:hypothetical protein